MSYQQLTEGQASPEVPVNENMQALGQAFLFAHDVTADTGLTVGVTRGRWNGATLADTTVACTDDATNYIVAHRTTGAVSASTASTNWNDTATYGRVGIAVFAGGVLTYHDERSSSGGVFDHAAGGIVAADVSITDAGGYFTGTDVEAALQELAADVGGAPPAEDVSVADAGGYYTGTDVEAVLQEVGAVLDAQPFVVGVLHTGAPGPSALVTLFAAPDGIDTLTAAAAMAGSSGKALTAATAQTDFDVRKNATSAATGTSVGTMRFAAAGTVPTFIAASGFTLDGGVDTLSVWAPATPDATLANIAASLYFTR
jgi:hypothetical protein